MFVALFNYAYFQRSGQQWLQTWRLAKSWLIVRLFVVQWKLEGSFKMMAAQKTMDQRWITNFRTFLFVPVSVKEETHSFTEDNPRRREKPQWIKLFFISLSLVSVYIPVDYPFIPPVWCQILRNSDPLTVHINHQARLHQAIFISIF